MRQIIAVFAGVILLAYGSAAAGADPAKPACSCGPGCKCCGACCGVKEKAKGPPATHAELYARVEAGEKFTDIPVGPGGISIPGRKAGRYDCYLAGGEVMMQEKITVLEQVPMSACPNGRCPLPARR